MILNGNCIIFDTETTGLYAGEDEILQLSIISGNGDVLFNEYIKPSRRKKWDAAQKIHHISPQMVKNCKTFRHYKKQIQEIFDSVEIIIAYKWQKLTTAARYYGYQFNAHDSLEDVRATLHVAKEIYKDK